MNFHRRRFIQSLGLGAGAGLLASCQRKNTNSSAEPVTHEKFEWKMVTTWPKNFPVLGTGANRLADRIEKMSSGRLKIKVYGAGELVPALGIFDAVQQGTAQIGHGAAYYWKGKHEASQFFGAVPFGMNAAEMNAWIYYGGGQSLWDELYAGFGLKPFAVGQTGVQMGGWFKKEIRSVSDFRGLKIRMPGLGGEVLRQLGATVVNLPGGELFQALQSNTIDAAEWVGPYNDLAFGFQQIVKNYYYPGWQEPTATLEAFINKKEFERLPSDLQRIVEYACQMSNQDMYSEFVARNATALETLVTKDKVKLQKFPGDVLKKLQAVSDEMINAFALKDDLSRRIFTSYQKFQKENSTYTKISEEAYTLARELPI
jgi:TRAP-type mannitol/chloroaromatic compound transport system substrate-binding protein